MPQVTKRNPPPKRGSATPTAQAPRPALKHTQLIQRLTGARIHPDSVVRVKLTMLGIFGERVPLVFDVKDVIITMADAGKPDLVELVVQN